MFLPDWTAAHGSLSQVSLHVSLSEEGSQLEECEKAMCLVEGQVPLETTKVQELLNCLRFFVDLPSFQDGIVSPQHSHGTRTSYLLCASDPFTFGFVWTNRSLRFKSPWETSAMRRSAVEFAVLCGSPCVRNSETSFFLSRSPELSQGGSTLRFLYHGSPWCRLHRGRQA